MWHHKASDFGFWEDAGDYTEEDVNHPDYFLELPYEEEDYFEYWLELEPSQKEKGELEKKVKEALMVLVKAVGEHFSLGKIDFSISVICLNRMFFGVVININNRDVHYWAKLLKTLKQISYSTIEYNKENNYFKFVLYYDKVMSMFQQFKDWGEVDIIEDKELDIEVLRQELNDLVQNAVDIASNPTPEEYSPLTAQHLAEVCKNGNIYIRQIDSKNWSKKSRKKRQRC